MYWPHMHPWEEPDHDRYDGYGRPGGASCLRCLALTWRPQRICSPCTGELERMIERIEIDSIEADLELLVRFEAYCHARQLLSMDQRGSSLPS
jgi:hypothetical protein